MKLVNLAVEAIDFQSPEFADELSKVMDKLLDYRDGKRAEGSKEYQQLHKLIKEKTNLNLKIHFNTDYPPCMLPIHLNPDSILGHNYFKDYYAKDSAAIFKGVEELATGYVDLKNAKVGGIFNKLTTQIYMGFEFLRHFKFTSREVVAILMHEIGHAFVAYELAFNTIKTNQILVGLHKAMLESDEKRFDYALKKTEKLIGENTGVYKELRDEKNSKVVTTVVLAKVAEKRKSELGTAAYDRNSYEALADNFAVRMGLGRDLVTALERLEKMYPPPPRWASVTMSLLSMCYMLIMSVFVVGSAVGGIILWGMFMGLGIFLSSDTREHNNTYDVIKVRYARVREQLVVQLKRKDLDRKFVKEVLADIKVVDKAIEEAMEDVSVFRIAANIFFPTNWILSSRKETQRYLEQLAANDLYVKAAELRSV